MKRIAPIGSLKDAVYIKALTRCQKVKSRREREIWNPHLQFREEKREMLRSVFWFEKRMRNFAKKIKKSAFISLVWRREGEILNIFSNFEMRKRNFANKAHDLRGDRDVEISNFSKQEREIHLHHCHSHFCFFFFCPKNAKLNLRHKEEFRRPNPE